MQVIRYSINHMVGNTAEGRPSLVRFGVFEVNLKTGELRKSGIRLRLQTQPFKILAVLLRQPGEVVSREELQRALWGSDTNVDFEHGLGTAINKLREALGDSSTAPRYIETLARRGYRFIAPVTELPSAVELPAVAQTSVVMEVPTTIAQTSVVLEVPVADSQPKAVAGHEKSSLRLTVWACMAAALAAGWTSWLIAVRQFSTTKPVRVRQITWSGRVYPGSPHDEAFANVVTDGVRLYFRVLDGGKFSIASAPLAGDEINSPILKISTPADIVSPTLDDISPDGSKLLVGDHAWSSLEWPLWSLPSGGGVAHRVSNVFAHDATWMPDGQSILYAFGHDLWITRDAGQEPALYAHLPGRGFRPRWSPDGSRLRLTLVDAKTRVMSLWEIKKGSKEASPVFRSSKPANSQCCGNWTPDGGRFLFQEMANGTSDIWLERHALFAQKPSAAQVTAGPLEYLAPVSSGRGEQLFAIGAQSHTRLNRFDRQAGHFANYLPDLSTAGRFAFSPDGSEVAWVSTNDGSLWRSRYDGTQRLQLTAPPFEVFMMAWSPDQQQLAIMGKHPGGIWKLYTIPAQGGDLKLLLPENRNQADPTWSPDGKSIAFGRTAEYMGEEGTQKSIYILDLATKALKEVPGSHGLFSPRWSSDGRFLAALPLDQRQLMLFDFVTGRWSSLAAIGVDNPVWTKDNQCLYFDDFMDTRKPIYRVRVSDKSVERIADLGNVEAADNLNYWFLGLSGDGMPVVSVDRWTADIYSIQQ